MIQITLSDPDITQAELQAVSDVLTTASISAGPVVRAFEAEFAARIGRRFAVAVPSGTIGMLLVLRAYDIGAGAEVIASPYGFRETAHAIALAGATPVFADIDYWAGTLVPAKVEAKITPQTRAIMVSNPNGHPAPWDEFRALAEQHNLHLLEDSTEAIGSRHHGICVGSFGDCAVFDFSQPSPIVCGEGGMVVTDDPNVAATLRRLAARKPEERGSVVIGGVAPLQAGMSDLAAALGLAQLRRLDIILAKRKQVALHYANTVRSFEGIKDPFIAPHADEVHWLLYVVHLGTRFTRSARDHIVDDLRTEDVEAAAYARPLHLQPRYFSAEARKGDLFVTEKVADRALALPFHTHLSAEQIAFIVGTMKDASINVGAGAAIY
jgi:dTDP-4-amino-4,6-dideoxygalactose transaminase